MGKLNKNNSKYFTIIFLLVTFPSIIVPAFAEESKTYDLAISLVGVGEINKKIGAYELDFWYSIFSEGDDLLVNPPPEVDFINGKDEQISSQYLASNIYEQRVRGTFVNNLDFHDFPFEKIQLKVEIEPVTPWTTEHVILQVDPASGIDDTAHVPGWFVTEPKFSVIEKKYNDSDDTYSRYVAEFSIERSLLGSFLKIIFPVLIVLAISFIAYIIPENFQVSAALALLPLIAVVFLHTNALEELPALGYLTLYDKMMIIVYAMIANNVISTGREIRQHVYHGQQKVRTINHFHLKLSPIIAASLTIILFIFV